MEAKAELQWTRERQFVARAGDGPAVVIDGHEPRSGPSPMELVLMGVAGCTAIDVLQIMEKRRANVTDLRIHIRGTRADEFPRRYTHIHIEYLISGTGIKPRDVERAIQLSEEKYCSATASLNATVEHSYKILDKLAT